MLIKKIYRYPIKGLQGEELQETDLFEEKRIVNDRRFALALEDTVFDGKPHWLKKAFFFALHNCPKLAKIKIDFSDNGMTIHCENDQYDFNFQNPKGKEEIDLFLRNYLADQNRGKVNFVENSVDAFTDSSKPYISLINLATVRHLESDFGEKIDPLRFRANFYIDTENPWDEFDWVEKKIQIGQAILQIIKKTDRCKAINTDLDKGEFGTNLVRFMMKNLKHIDCGIFGIVIQSGKVSKNDKIEIL